jgi:multidrug efflux pump subunit AcrB
LKTVPVKQLAAGQLLLRDVATVNSGTMPGQYDRYNMKRQVSLTANIAGADLGSVARQVQRAIAAAGEPPKGSTVEVRGQIPPMQEMRSGLGLGLALAVVVIFLLLAANFQSWKLAFVTVSAAPAAILGVVLLLWITRTTLNIQSFMGAIMAVGVAMANGILLVTFAEEQRRAAGAGCAAPTEKRTRADIAKAAVGEAASRRLRPIVMTSAAMIAGMLPMALAWGEGGQQVAPLGRAVVGGLLMATLATLLVVPCIFSLVQGRAKTDSASLDPDDPDSPYFDHAVA